MGQVFGGAVGGVLLTAKALGKTATGDFQGAGGGFKSAATSVGGGFNEGAKSAVSGITGGIFGISNGIVRGLRNSGTGVKDAFSANEKNSGRTTDN